MEFGAGSREFEVSCGDWGEWRTGWGELKANLKMGKFEDLKMGREELKENLRSWLMSGQVTGLLVTGYW